VFFQQNRKNILAHIMADDSEYTSVDTEQSHIIFPSGNNRAEIAEINFGKSNCSSVRNKNITATAEKNADIKLVASTGGEMNIVKILPSNVYNGYPVG